jgi:hypothetical protein
VRAVAHDLARDFIGPATIAATVALALVPAPRWAAWAVLAALPPLVASRVTRSAGFTAAVTAGMLYLVAHGRPRFTTVVTDQLTIRMSFILAAVGAAGALAAATSRDDRDDSGRVGGI